MPKGHPRPQSPKKSRNTPAYQRRLTVAVTEEQFSAVVAVSAHRGISVPGRPGGQLLRKLSVEEAVLEYKRLLRSGELRKAG